MKEGRIEKQDGEALLDIVQKINTCDGTLKESLTVVEMTLLFCIADAIRKGKW